MPASSATALLDAPWYVDVHIVLALISVVVGAVVLKRRKGTPAHRLLGRIWVATMLSLTLISFAIQKSGQLSPIHILSVITLVSIPLAIYFVRRGWVRAHRFTMGATFAGLAIAGVFTLLPQRMLGQLIFGAP